ncbi:DUF559 domain-containing protein [Nakamurella sp. YIM 132087]|uniref:DUF559 domain-containing protein n=1 Tax=Nakamurella alba TaxID=2665158 RepID=A0A7K1FL68_9ACTN|nr:DUF559 domain-containing protein [Nakamurella alba]MTD14846.1 DUF559 domain-containing protein [Nakamurella alba]
MGRNGIEKRLHRQDGVIHRDQVISAGGTSRQIELAVERREWIRVLPGVYRAIAFPESVRSRIRAAALWSGDGSAVAGWAAAWWWQVTTDEPPEVEIHIARNRGLRARPGIRLVKREPLDDELVRHSGLLVMDRVSAVIQAAVAMGAGGLQLLDRQLQKAVITIDDLEHYIQRHRHERGNHGVRRLMAVARDGAAAESERRCMRILRSAGITGWQTGFEIPVAGRVYHPDLAFPRERVLIEIDGLAWHTDPDRFRIDRRRQNDLVILGWTVLRFTWYDLEHAPETVVRSVRAALASGRPRP